MTPPSCPRRPAPPREVVDGPLVVLPALEAVDQHVPCVGDARESGDLEASVSGAAGARARDHQAPQEKPST